MSDKRAENVQKDTLKGESSLKANIQKVWKIIMEAHGEGRLSENEINNIQELLFDG